MNYVQNFCKIRAGRLESPGLTFAGTSTSVDQLVEEIYMELKPEYPKFYKMDRQSQLGFLAAEVVLGNAGELRHDDNIAVVLSNAEGSLDTDLRYQQSVATIASPALFVYTLPSIVAGEICIRHKLKGENAFFVMPSFDADTLVSYVDVMLDTSPTKVCLAGWVDVLGGQYDVFLYLVSRNFHTGARPHKAEELEKLYLQ